MHKENEIEAFDKFRKFCGFEMEGVCTPALRSCEFVFCPFVEFARAMEECKQQEVPEDVPPSPTCEEVLRNLLVRIDRNIEKYGGKHIIAHYISPGEVEMIRSAVNPLIDAADN